MAERILIVEDEETLRESLKRVLSQEGYSVDTVGSAEAAIQGLEDGSYDLIITDIILPGIDGIELVRRVREKSPDQAVIVITAYASLETAVGALRAGAYDYVVKPIIHEELKRTIRNALREKALKAENLILKKQIEGRYNFENIIGQSKVITTRLDEVKKIADSRSNVLLLGETGTGKELFARAVHYYNSRREKPFIPINCSAIPDTLLESELFGYTKGAFTGAVTSKKGLFEEADGGTVFLDEIADMSLSLQAKLLRVIDDLEIRPLGGVQSRKIDVRFITATNRDIVKAVKDGAFREDLYYRINVVTLKLPPLRERKEDIMILARHFLEKYSNELGKRITKIDEMAQTILMNYSWYGNVRELQNIIERAVLVSDRDTILPEHLPETLQAIEDYPCEALNKALSIESYTKEFILRYQSGHSENELADMLGITRKSLWEKRKRWGLARDK